MSQQEKRQLQELRDTVGYLTCRRALSCRAFLVSVCLIVSGCASESLIVAGDLSSYEREGAFFRKIDSLSEAAYEAITKDCKNRREWIDETGVELPSIVSGLQHVTNKPSAPGSEATTPQAAADVLAFTLYTRDFLDAIFPRVRVKVTAKCRQRPSPPPPIRPLHPYKIVSWFHHGLMTQKQRIDDATEVGTLDK